MAGKKPDEILQRQLKERRLYRQDSNGRWRPETPEESRRKPKATRQELANVQQKDIATLRREKALGVEFAFDEKVGRWTRPAPPKPEAVRAAERESGKTFEWDPLNELYRPPRRIPEKGASVLRMEKLSGDEATWNPDRRKYEFPKTPKIPVQDPGPDGYVDAVTGKPRLRYPGTAAAFPREED